VEVLQDRHSPNQAKSEDILPVLGGSVVNWYLLGLRDRPRMNDLEMTDELFYCPKVENVAHRANMRATFRVVFTVQIS